jgi:NAD(P)-dependent dehydrogenase (short-subunit alcohol dehydrogenase family)
MQACELRSLQTQWRCWIYLLTFTSSGKATVIGLASHGATVYMGARSEVKALETIKDIKKELPSSDIRFLFMDLMKLETVVSAAHRLRKYVSFLS